MSEVETTENALSNAMYQSFEIKKGDNNES